MVHIQSIMLLLLIGFLQMIEGQDRSPDTSPDNTLTEKITSTEGCIALWTFSEPAGLPRKAIGMHSFPLREGNQPVKRIEEGPLSGYSILLTGSEYLTMSNDITGPLNLYGEGQGVTVVAWVKWTGEQIGFVGGMWNEHVNGGKRQYGLFISLPMYNGENQVCGHISVTGKATPPFPYSIDYSASRQKVEPGVWTCAAFTYDGEYIRSFVNGDFEAREPELINHTKGYEGYPEGLIQSKNPYYFPYGMGNNGSDFTVGAVRLKNGMGNLFKGQIGGLAVFDRALTEEELKMFVE